MKVAVVGVGKLGLCWAALCAEAGHQVIGFDTWATGVRHRVSEVLAGADLSEAGLQDLLVKVGAPEVFDRVADLFDVDVAYVCVQTPHDPHYSGETPMPAALRDFDYSYLIDAVQDIANDVRDSHRRDPLTLVIMSTVLPGTIDKHIRPLVEALPIRLVYSPAFISLGTTIDGFRNPPLALLGADPATDCVRAEAVYYSIVDQPQPPQRMLIPDAEMTKVALNTWISTQINYANALAFLCDHAGANVDRVVGTLMGALTKPMHAGLGDGGPCRPRDAIAMQSLSDLQVPLALDPFAWAMQAREAHVRTVAAHARDLSRSLGLPMFLLGVAYKPGVAYTFGSPALRLRYELGGEVPFHDPHLWKAGHTALGDELVSEPVPDLPHLFIVGTPHPDFRDLPLPARSVVLDHWGIRQPQDGVQLITPGRNT